MRKITFLFIIIVLIACLFGCGTISKQIDTPTGVRIEDGVLKWNSVDGASEYKIFCDELEVDSVTGTYYDLSTLNLDEGKSYVISIKAFGDGYYYLASEFSENISYTQGAQEEQDSIDNTKEPSAKPGKVEDTNIARTLFDAGLGYGVNALTDKSAISAEGGYSQFFDASAIDASNLGKRAIGSSKSNATTREDISSEISAVNAKMVYGSSASASLAGMFTAGFSEKFSLGTEIRSELKTNQMYFILNLYVIGENYELLNYRQPKAYNNKLSEYALSDLQDLRDNKLTPERFFNTYGTHLKMAVSYGGMTEVCYAVFSKSELDSAKISTALEAKLNAGFSLGDLGVSGSTEIGAQLERDFIFESQERTTNLHIESIGKRPSTYLTFDSFAQGYNGWVSQFDDESNYRIVDVADGGLVPIWTYFPSEYSDVAETLSQYFYEKAIELGNKLAEKMAAPVAAEDRGDVVHFASGHGTQESPYLLTSKEHFINMMELENAEKYYVLKNDIDLGDWSEYGIYNWAKNKSTAPKAFKGNFDGENHTITYSIRIGKTTIISWALGLFPCVKSATIKNVRADCDISTYDPKNRKQKWDISNDDRACDVMVGGIVGYAYGSTIKNCRTQGNIKYNSDGGENDTSVGGVVGFAKKCTLIENCSSSASIYARGCWIEIGGVIGLTYKSEYSSLNFTGSRKSNEDWAFTGQTWSNALIGRTEYDILPD